MTLKAVSNIKFSDLTLNLDMNNTLREYPPSCGPKINRLAQVFCKSSFSFINEIRAICKEVGLFTNFFT